MIPDKPINYPTVLWVSVKTAGSLGGHSDLLWMPVHIDKAPIHGDKVMAFPGDSETTFLLDVNLRYWNGSQLNVELADIVCVPDGVDFPYKPGSLDRAWYEDRDSTRTELIDMLVERGWRK